MAGSAADAISQAVERSKQLLFSPVKADKWFALGFTVFLAQCGESNGSFGTRGNLPGFPGGTTSGIGRGTSGLPQAIRDGIHALKAELAFYLGLAAVGLLLAVGIWLLVLWFSSRAKLMFVESVVWDRVDVGEQWTRAAPLGMSLFKFRALVSLTTSGLLLGLVGGAIAVGFSDFETANFTGPGALAAYAMMAAATLLLAMPVAVLMALLDDFVVPLMVVRNAPVAEAWRLCRAEVLAGNVGGIFIFYVLRVILGIGSAIIVVTLTCVTCCLTAVPYLGTVLLLPLFVFSRAYPLYFMEQLGVRVFPAPEPAWAAYDQWRFPH